MDIEKLKAFHGEFCCQHAVLRRHLTDFACAEESERFGLSTILSDAADFLAFVEERFKREDEVMASFAGTAADDAFTHHRQYHAGVLAEIMAAVAQEARGELLNSLRGIIRHLLDIHLDVHDRLLQRCVEARLALAAAPRRDRATSVARPCLADSESE